MYQLSLFSGWGLQYALIVTSTSLWFLSTNITYGQQGNEVFGKQCCPLLYLVAFVQFIKYVFYQEEVWCNTL